MPGKIVLTVTKGMFIGKTFTFEKHDTFLLGRQQECHICLPQDPMVSRHHFLLEVNPPQARLYDLGSRNGTFVNGVRYGGRLKHETPEEGERRQYPNVDLQHNDIIRVGDTIIHFEIQNQQTQQTQKIVYCQQCGRNVSVEAGPGYEGDFLCSRCRQSLENNPAALLLRMFAEAPEQSPKGISLANYQIQKKLGEGGMGAVYLLTPKARMPGHDMALKVMSAKTAVNAYNKQAFLREIKNTQRLEHAHIVRFLGSGAEKSSFYFLLEYCQGGSVSSLIDRRGGRLTLTEAGPIMLQTLQGLAYAHHEGFVHRDLKPQNILLSGTEGNWRAKIADFGLAKNFLDAGLSGMTISGDGFAGSALFMPREQITDFKYAKPESDIWSIGATFYYMLTGQFPRPNEPGMDPVKVILHHSHIPLRQTDPQLPPSLATIIDRSLAFHAKERYRTGGEMLSALTKVLKKLKS